MRVVAPELMASEPAFDPVDVLYSQASFRTRWMLDQRGRGAAWSNRDAAREYEDNAWRASRQQVLQRLSEIGIQPRLLSSAMVEAGALRHDGSRALILPHSIALSQAEADEIRAFARRGGTVLADTEPGLFDQHSRRLPAPLLAGIAALPDAMMLDAGQIALKRSRVGALLRNAGVPPRADLRGPDGQTANGIDAVWLRHGATTILALQAVAPWGAPARIEVRSPLPAMVENMRSPGRSLRAERIRLIWIQSSQPSCALDADWKTRTAPCPSRTSAHRHHYVIELVMEVVLIRLLDWPGPEREFLLRCAFCSTIASHREMARLSISRN